MERPLAEILTIRFIRQYKTALFYAFTGWALLLSYLVYDYINYGFTFLEHFLDPHYKYELFFHLLMGCAPFISTFAGYTEYRKTRYLEELKSAMAKVEEERAKAQAILESVGDGISVQDRDFSVLFQNRLHIAMVGEHIGEYCYKGYQQRDKICEGCHLAMSFEDGLMHKKEQVRKTDTGTFYYEITSTPLRDASGKIVGGIEAVRDITERRMTEKKIAESEEQYRLLVNNIPAVAWTSDSTGHTVFISPVVEKIYGFTPEEIYGGGDELWFGRIHSEDRDRVKMAYSKLFADETPFDIEYRIMHKNGTWIWLHDRAYATVKQAGQQYAYGVFTDITAHKKMEEEVLKSQKLESLSVLAGGIAHDFNNILTSVIGNISLMRLYLKPEDPIYERLDQTERAALQAQKLTNQLLTFAKGGLPVKKVISLGPLIRDLAVFALRGTGVRPEFFFPDDLWRVEADEGQIGQVFNNLIINACQAMPDGGTVRLRAENTVIGPRSDLPLVKGNYVRVSVEDEGTGIPAKYLEKIFDPYFTTKKKGSGLGLAVTYSIIRNHDGHIAVASKPGTGTVFTVYLPATGRQADRETQSEEQVMTGRGRVLVMDDEEMVRNVASAILEKLGYEVAFVSEGAEAIAAYRDAMDRGRPFDAVIMDLTIPGGMGGKEAVRELCRVDPCCRVVVSSGYSQDDIMTNFAEYGFMGVIRKPYNVVEMSRVIHKMMQGSQG